MYARSLVPSTGAASYRPITIFRFATRDLGFFESRSFRPRNQSLIAIPTNTPIAVDRQIPMSLVLSADRGKILLPVFPGRALRIPRRRTQRLQEEAMLDSMNYKSGDRQMMGGLSRVTESPSSPTVSRFNERQLKS